MTSSKFERPRGTRDFGPADMAKRRWLEGVFRETFRKAGYREVQTPTFEHTALFEAKSGPNVLDEIYHFKDKGDRDICLRPELTAPVLRYYVSDLSQEPKPIKLYYYGSCFRYEQPQEGRYREFWQFGLELLGPEGPSADAEVVAMAVQAVRDAGLKDFILHVGHIGVLRALMEYVYPPIRPEIYRAIDKDDPSLAEKLPDAYVLGPAVRTAIVGIARHRRKVQTGDGASVDAFFAEAKQLLQPLRELEGIEKSHGALNWKPVVEKAGVAAITRSADELRETIKLLHAYGVDELELDLGVARGLDYYTGMVFELEAPSLGAQKQIGGGGAYSLIPILSGNDTELRGVNPPGPPLGGEHVGTAGFGLGFDRILLALERENGVPTAAPASEAYVAVLGAGARVPALQLARGLRAAGISADVDLMGRNLSKALQYASKAGARVVVIVGEKDLAAGNVTLRDMASGEQRAVPLAEAGAAVKATLGKGAPKPGTIVHAELYSSDPAATQAFYQNVFGWKFHEIPNAGYWLIEAPGRPHGGMLQRRAAPPGGFVPPSTLNYILVANVDEAAKRIVEAGGRIVVPRYEIPGMGVFSVFEAPGGVVHNVVEVKGGAFAWWD